MKGDSVIDIDVYAKIGAQVCGRDLENPPVQFVQFLFGHRVAVAEQIAGVHPSFAPVLHAMRLSSEVASGDGEGLGELLSAELDAMFELLQNDPSVANDVYFTVLFAGQGTFMERNSEDRGVSTGLITLVDNIGTAGLRGLPAILVLTAALWFSDFKDYRSRLYQKNNELKREGWYSS